jgi:hypothetical protein
MTQSNEYAQNSPADASQRAVMDDLRRSPLMTPRMGRGVGLPLVDTPALLVNAWRYGVSEEIIVEQMVAAGQGTAATLFERLDAAIQDHLAAVMADPHRAHLFRLRLANKPLAADDCARAEEVLWQELYAWEPRSSQSRERLEGAVLARLRRVLA